VRLFRWPAFAGFTLSLLNPFSQAQACGIALSETGTITITAGTDVPCDSAALRTELKQAIAVAEAASASGRSGGGQRQGAFANQARTTGSNLYKLGTAPSAEPPPTRIVMPGSPR
jgi:hypothetical protein